MEKFVVIDGNSLINRAFYGLPMLRSLSGKPCNAIFGFVNMLINMVENEKPKYLACVFDAGKHTFRHDMYAEYKGTRNPTPEDLRSQITGLKELLKIMGVKVLEKAEIEADDIVGTLSRKFNEEFVLISGDKDLLQLINNNTTVWLTQKGISNVLKVDEQVLMSEFKLKPYQVIEMKSIMGDSSDNIPGVAGIGKIGAEKLIQQYDNLDNIYNNLDNLATGVKNKLVESREMAYLSKKLATIKLDVEIDAELKDFEFSLPLNQEAYMLMKEYDFKSLISKQNLFQTEGFESIENISNNNAVEVEVVEIENENQLNEMCEFLGENFAFNFDDLSWIFGKENKEYVVYVSGELFANNLEKIKKIFENAENITCFDAKNAMYELKNHNISLKKYFDVSLAMYIVNELDAEISFEDSLKINNIQTQSKACVLNKIKEICINKLIQSSQLKLYSDIELPLVKVLFDMECSGIKIDTNQIKTLSEIYHKELDELSTKIYELAGEEFNINSPKQLQVILFEKLQLEYKGKKGTSVEVLTEIESQHEIVSHLLRYRKIAKLISTYLDGMLNYVREDGKIHTKFMQKTTTTGRLSSREPNLQNLPIRDDEGRVLRKMFSSSFENGTIISADYNQIELRLIANFSGDKNMIEDYLSGKDIHTATASKIFGVSIEEVTKNMRRVAKSVNFGIIYGIGAYGLSQNIKSSVKEAGQFINKYLEVYPQVKEYGDKCVEEAKEKGYSTTMMGRIRHLNDIHSANPVMRKFAERVAKNMPLQGSASDIIKIAMIKVHQRIKDQNLNSKLILQIHDELVVDCYPGEQEKVCKILKEEMESVVDLKVPLIVEVEQGKTLYDAK